MMVTAYTQPLNYSSPSVQFTVATQVNPISTPLFLFLQELLQG